MTAATAGAAGGPARTCRSGPAILGATLELLAERGIEGLTIDGVAARARVGKATIYRHWRSRAELVMDAMASLPVGAPPAPTGDLRADLCATFAQLGEALSDPLVSRLMAALVDAAERDPELAELHAARAAVRRAPARRLMVDAVARGDLPASLDVDTAVDLIAGPLFYRRLVSHQPVTPAVIADVVDTALAGLRHAG